MKGGDGELRKGEEESGLGRTWGNGKLQKESKERITENGVAMRVATMDILQLGSIVFSFFLFYYCV